MLKSRQSSLLGFVTFVVAAYGVLFLLVQTPEPRFRPAKRPPPAELQPSGRSDETPPPVEGFQHRKATWQSRIA